QMMVWNGKEGRFENDEKIVVHSTGLAGIKSAVAGVTVKQIENNNNNNVSSTPSIDLLCVGTSTGAIGWVYSAHVSNWSLKGIGRIEMEALEVMGLAVEVCEQFAVVDAKTIQFGVRLYILTARRVRVQQLRLTIGEEGGRVLQISRDDLFHFVSSPRHLSIEPSLPSAKIDIKEKKSDKTKKKELPQRIIVTGGKEYEVLLLCPNKMAIEKPLPSLVSDEDSKKKSKNKKEKEKKKDKIDVTASDDGRMQLRNKMAQMREKRARKK
ncbi:hypothetical protein PFISCL1PPCAC_20770, partial [Pristionchus fissidentatus]